MAYLVIGHLLTKVAFLNTPTVHASALVCNWNSLKCIYNHDY